MKTIESLHDKPLSCLLALHDEIMKQLRTREIIRTYNNLTGDLSEYLFRKAFEWKPEANSKKGVDATDNDGVRYQIKGRKPNQYRKSRQLSDIRSFEFDFLAAVLFDDGYRVERAALIPVDVVRAKSKYVKHTNAHRFMLQDNVWNVPEVREVTEDLCKIHML